jgi:hypothetical protein
MASAANVPVGDETELNMTPMIDVVFQLILFFLFTLKFKSIDRRIDASLPAVGPFGGVPFDPVVQHVRVTMFRKDKADRKKAFTRLRVVGDTTVDLPPGPWPESGEGDEARRRAYDEKFRLVTARIRQAWEAQGLSPDVKGEIKASPPEGGAVPSGDVIRVLDAFLEAGLTGVDFVGAPAPLPTSEGGTMFRIPAVPAR